MNGPFSWLDRVEVDALVTDRYLDALLATPERHAVDAPADTALDPALRAAARALQAGALRVHPSFRFEERLARQLADAGAGAAQPRIAFAGGGPTVVAFEPAGAIGVTAHAGSERGIRPGRPLLVGGAITSAALSIVGAAFVAWRITRGDAPLSATPDLPRRLD